MGGGVGGFEERVEGADGGVDGGVVGGGVGDPVDEAGGWGGVRFWVLEMREGGWRDGLIGGRGLGRVI